jgi:hypothetical protein
MLIVIARYNEDIEWSKKYSSNVLIINKGERIEGFDNQIFYPNVGREGHSYYKYIYDNYDNLDDYIIFLQGNPLDHSPDIINILDIIINIYNKNKDDLMNIIINNNIIKYTIIDCGNNNLNNIYVNDIKNSNFIYISQYINKTSIKTEEKMWEKCRTIVNSYRKVFDIKIEDDLNFLYGAGAQFLVSKKSILKYPKEYYEKFYKLLDEENDPIEGYTIERFHKYIFD